MQKQIAKQPEIGHPISPATSPKSKGRSLIVCPIFRKELEKVLQELGLAPRISYMHYTIHNNPMRMEEELQSSLEKVRTKNNDVRFLVGRHCKGKRDMTEVVEDCGGKIPQARNCIDMLIGDELTKKLQKDRTSLMTPAWIRMINQSIKEGQWTVSDARLNLGWYNKILILDTGVETLSDEQIMEFYDLTQVEIEILPVDLSHFKNLLQELLQ
ncbi:MAG: DUF1638 domain-containing protein [Proteobacteria bacterium]|nr:DUF1638 domain-containing protein [Pseudomonadota bacterium]MBU1231258.1 DUF1638 domain-containing protein [Pseudomonadota bacterium]MBU1417345.1 DUF1638 domain-containing protein [Pseudomonadota bacterium]MBU1455298.1 DUF1638 domain-containing protein [Pseudomonadota bacterium]